MGVTPTYGYPYPEDTDPVSQGAQAIKALALAVEGANLISSADPTPLPASTALTVFPLGITLYNLSAILDWPEQGMVTTFHMSFGGQILWGINGHVYMRGWHWDGHWSPWATVQPGLLGALIEGSLPSPAPSDDDSQTDERNAP